jgi:hypothetical protein
MTRIGFVALMLTAVFAIGGVGDAPSPPDPLSDAHALVYEDRFIDAYLALDPLLLSDQRSDEQEEALWLAERLCAAIAAQVRLPTRYEAEHGPPREGHQARRRWQKALIDSELVGQLNALGAAFQWDELAGGFRYGHAFARQLLAKYPKAKRRQAAEYYAIRPGYNRRERVDVWMAELADYVARYGDSGTLEITLARRSLAGIYGNLWQLLTHERAINEAAPFVTDDAEADARRAEKYRQLALRLHADYLLSSAGTTSLGHPDAARETAQRLRLGESDHSAWMLRD